MAQFRCWTGFLILEIFSIFLCLEIRSVLNLSLIEGFETPFMGVKVLFHVFGVGGIKEGNQLKGVFIESIEGKRAILGKVIVDVTGSADISWKSGPEVFSDGFPDGPKKGRHAGFGYTFLTAVWFPRIRMAYWPPVPPCPWILSYGVPPAIALPASAPARPREPLLHCQ